MLTEKNHFTKSTNCDHQTKLSKSVLKSNKISNLPFVYPELDFQKSEIGSKTEGVFIFCRNINEALLGGGGGGELVIPYPLNSGGSYPLSLKLPRLLSPKLLIF